MKPLNPVLRYWVRLPLALLAVTGLCAQEVAPRVINFRNGPTGAFPDATPPLEWSVAKNVIWQWDAPVGDTANGAPIMVGDKLFTICSPTMLVCLDKRTGRELWLLDSHAVKGAAGEEKVYEAEQWARHYGRIRWLKHVAVPAANKALTPLQESFDGMKRVIDAVKEAPEKAELTRRLEQLQGIAAENAAKATPFADELKQLEASPPPDYPGRGQNMVNWPCATAPATDGERVYAFFHPGVVACYDLEGRRQWVRLVQAPNGNYPGVGWGGDSAEVPIAFDGKLLILMGNELQLLDAKTGKMLWRVGSASGNAAGPQVGRGGDGEYYYVLPSLGIGRVSDGEIIYSCSRGGYYPVTLSPEGDVAHYLHSAIRLPREKGGKCEELWKMAPELWGDGGIVRGHSYSAAVCSGGLLYYHETGGPMYLFDAVTGEMLREPLVSDALVKSYPPLILAGKYLFTTSDDSVTSVFTADKEYRLIAVNRLWDSTVGNMSPIFEDNRLYFRTTERLYCIGSAIDGMPQDDPAVAKTIRAMTKSSELIPYLTSASIQYRYEAALALLKNDPKAASTKWKDLALNDPREEIRAIAVKAMDAASSDGKGGAGFLREQVSVRSSNTVETTTRLVCTLKTLGPKYADAVPLLFILLNDEKNEQNRLIAAKALDEEEYVTPEVREGLLKRVPLGDQAGEKAPGIRTVIVRNLTRWPLDPQLQALFIATTLGGGPGQTAEQSLVALDYLRRKLPAAELVPTMKKLAASKEDKVILECVPFFVKATDSNTVAEVLVPLLDRRGTLLPVVTALFNCKVGEAAATAAIGKCLPSLENGDWGFLNQILPFIESRILCHADPAVRAAMVPGLVGLATSKRSVWPNYKATAAVYLGRLGADAKPALDALRQVVTDPHKPLADAATAAIAAIEHPEPAKETP